MFIEVLKRNRRWHCIVLIIEVAYRVAMQIPALGYYTLTKQPLLCILVISVVKP